MPFRKLRLSGSDGPFQPARIVAQSAPGNRKGPVLRVFAHRPLGFAAQQESGKFRITRRGQPYQDGPVSQSPHARPA